MHVCIQLSERMIEEQVIKIHTFRLLGLKHHSHLHGKSNCLRGDQQEATQFQSLAATSSQTINEKRRFAAFLESQPKIN